MAKISNKQAMLTALKLMGFVEEYGRSRKFQVFFDTASNIGGELIPIMPERLILVGAGGALRMTETLKDPLHTSRSISDTIFAKLLQEFGRTSWKEGNEVNVLRRAFVSMRKEALEKNRAAKKTAKAS